MFGEIRVYVYHPASGNYSEITGKYKKIPKVFRDEFKKGHIEVITLRVSLILSLTNYL